eukprot:FR740104.1.p1 GENE.FR740104.1~~FR740104.1.p1  ORF type:complete len:140 (+),score=15.70 FR740104.1:320-739(+)
MVIGGGKEHPTPCSFKTVRTIERTSISASPQDMTPAPEGDLEPNPDGRGLWGDKTGPVPQSPMSGPLRLTLPNTETGETVRNFLPTKTRTHTKHHPTIQQEAAEIPLPKIYAHNPNTAPATRQTGHGKGELKKKIFYPF